MQYSTCRNCTNCGCTSKKNADVGGNLSIGNHSKTGDSMAKKLVTLNRIDNKTFVSYLSLSSIFGFSNADDFYDAAYRVFYKDNATASLYVDSVVTDIDTNIVWFDAAACMHLKKFLPLDSEAQEIFNLLMKALRADEEPWTYTMPRYEPAEWVS